MSVIGLNYEAGTEQHSPVKTGALLSTPRSTDVSAFVGLCTKLRVLGLGSKWEVLKSYFRCLKPFIVLDTPAKCPL